MLRKYDACLLRTVNWFESMKTKLMYTCSYISFTLVALLVLVSCNSLPLVLTSEQKNPFVDEVYDLPNIKVVDLSRRSLQGADILYFNPEKDLFYVFVGDDYQSVIDVVKNEKIDVPKDHNLGSKRQRTSAIVEDLCKGLDQLVCNIDNRGFLYAYRSISLDPYIKPLVQLVDIRSLDDEGLEKLAQISTDEDVLGYAAKSSGNSAKYLAGQYSEVPLKSLCVEAFSQGETTVLGKAMIDELRSRNTAEASICAYRSTESDKDIENLKRQLDVGGDSKPVLSYISTILNGRTTPSQKSLAKRLADSTLPHIDKELLLAEYQSYRRWTKNVHGTAGDPLQLYRSASSYQNPGLRGFTLPNTKYAVGLIWQDTSDNINKTLTQPEAENYCSRLEQNGIKDWHLPFPDDVEDLFEQYPNTNQLFDYASGGYPTQLNTGCDGIHNCTLYYSTRDSSGFRALSDARTTSNVRCVTTTIAAQKARAIAGERLGDPTSFSSAISSFDQTQSPKYLEFALSFAELPEQQAEVEFKLAEYIGWPNVFDIDSQIDLAGAGDISEIGNQLGSFIMTSNELRLKYKITPKFVEGFELKLGDYSADLSIKATISLVGKTTIISTTDRIDRDRVVPVKLSKANGWSAAGSISLGELFSASKASLLGLDIDVTVSGVDNSVSLKNIKLVN